MVDLASSLKFRSRAPEAEAEVAAAAATFYSCINVIHACHSLASIHLYLLAGSHAFRDLGNARCFCVGSHSIFMSFDSLSCITQVCR